MTDERTALMAVYRAAKNYHPRFEHDWRCEVPVGPPWESNRDAQAYLRALEHKGPVSPLRDEE